MKKENVLSNNIKAFLAQLVSKISPDVFFFNCLYS